MLPISDHEEFKEKRVEKQASLGRTEMQSCRTTDVKKGSVEPTGEEGRWHAEAVKESQSSKVSG